MINEYNARKFCCEDISLIENYQEAAADPSQTWQCHHRLEIQGPFVNSVKLLKRCGMYYHQPASALIFLEPNAHRRLHNRGEKNPFFGKCHTEATKRKLSQALRGICPSKESRMKMSQAKLGNNYLLGYHWWTNGVESVCAKICPPGFVKGRVCRRQGSSRSL